MTLGEKLETIARRIPDVFGKGKAVGYQEGYWKGYEKGSLDGGIAGREVCLLNHYVDSVLGNGEPYMEFAVPFEPDFVTIYSSNTYANEVPNCFKGLEADLRACGRYVAHIQYCNNSGQNTAATIRSGMKEEIFTYKDGIWRFQLRATQDNIMCWHKNVRYNVVAVQYSEETAAGLVQEQIALLPDTPPAGSTGTLTYTQSCIDRCFTPAQWQALIATKPKWNFVMV